MSGSRSARIGTPQKRKGRGAAASRARSERGQREQQQRTEQLQRERREARLAGCAALLSVACWIGALFTVSTAGGARTEAGRGLNAAPVSSAKQLTAYHSGRAQQVVATGLRCAALLLVVAVGFWLYRLVRSRRGATPAWLPLLTVVAAALLAVSAVLGYFALDHAANTFVASGPRTSTRAKHLIDHSGAGEFSRIFDFVARIVFAGWIAALSREMSKALLLDGFMTYWAYFGATAFVLLPVGDAMFIAWLGSVGVIALGFWPGGRPEGWDKLAKTG